MGINKVIYNGQVLIDLTSSTVTPKTLLEGTIAFNSAGEKIVGTLVISGGYTNLVPTSIDTDGSVYNGVGYMDGYRLSSSGSLSQQDNTATTGFIPCKSTDTIRMGGTRWSVPEATTSSYNYIAFYDEDFTLLGSLNIFNPSGGMNARGIVDEDESKSSVITDEKGVTTFRVAFSDGSKVAYCRVSGYGKGADMIVTINEAIGEKPYTYTNQVSISINADGSIYNGGLGYKKGYRVRSGGAEGENAQATCTGYIPFKVGDTLRISPALVTNSTTNACINFSDGSFTNLGQSNQGGTAGVQYGICLGNTQYFVPTIVDGISVLTLSNLAPSANEIKYIRITHNTDAINGKSFIVTVNEEIK